MRFTTFLTIAAIAAVIVFLALISFSRSYTTQTLLLVLPKSTVSAVQADHVIENIATLSGYPHFTQKTFPYSLNNTWDGTVTTIRKDGTGIIALRTKATNAADAAVINKTITQSAIKRISHFYNIAKDVDVRIVGAPTQTRSIGGNILPTLLVSIFTGLVIAALITGVSALLRLIASRSYGSQTRYQPAPAFSVEPEAEKKMRYEDVVAQPAYTFDGQDEYAAARRAEELAKVGVHDAVADTQAPADLFETHAPQATSRLDTSDRGTAHNMSGAAPANLPIAGVTSKTTAANVQEDAEEVIQQVAQQERARVEALEEDMEDAVEDYEKKIDATGEPTDEELKERLNKLLKGEL